MEESHEGTKQARHLQIVHFFVFQVHTPEETLRRWKLKTTLNKEKDTSSTDYK